MRTAVVVIAALLALIILFVPAYILWRTWSGAGGSSAAGLLTLNLKDSTRLANDDPAALGVAVSATLFPTGSDVVPGAVVITPVETWQAGVAAVPLLRWINGPLLLDDGSEAIQSEVERLQPAGVNALDGATVIRIGLDQAPDAGAEVAVLAGSGAELAARVDELVERLTGAPHPNVLLVPEDPGYALPAAYWAAQSGDALLFGGNPLPEATRQALERRGGQARIYLIGPGLEVEGLSGYGQVQQMGARDPVAAAVAIAKYHDQAAGVGWGIDGSRYFASRNFVLANQANPELAVAGLALGRFGKVGPLLWTERDRISPATHQYLWKMKPLYFITPAEGRFNHLWVLGGLEQISYTVQGNADLTQEIGAYRFADAGLSGMEVIWVVWVIAGIACGLWLLLHSWRRVPQISPMMRVTWLLLGLALGPLAVWLYRRSYHRVPWMRHGEMVMWHRSGFAPALAASAMNRGFDGPLMLVISWIVTWLGLPLLVFRGPFFWLGTSMMIGIYIAYFGALALHWLVMHAAMFMHHEGLSYGQAVRRAFQPAFFSMTAMAVGMMGFMWWIQMVNLMMEGMQESDDIMWWGTTLFAILVGWLVALPVDAWLVQRNKQPGSM